MKTERLYWEDAYLRTFEARIIARGANDLEVALDRTAFYPEGGGQPADHGRLNGIAVIDVQSTDDLIWHRVAAPIPEDTVMGEIDWARRFDHMQQHHGQHLLSAAFEHVCAARTTAFHLGATATTIDIAAAGLLPEQLAAVEAQVNEWIWANLPITARFVAAEELATLPLRKPPSVTGPVRVVAAGSVDYSACGGTHPSATGAVGMLHIRKVERRGAESRIEFVCGGRALGDLRTKHTIASELAGALSVGIDQLPEAFARLREAEAEARRGLEQARLQLTDLEAATLLAAAPDGVASQLWEERPFGEVRALAAAISARGGAAVFAVRQPKAQLLAADGSGARDCAALLRTVLEDHGGRGGGQPGLAQGGIPAAAELDGAFAQLLATMKSN